MSPRRMDISSLLRDPSPPHDDRPALPASLLSILNAPHSPPPRPPFLGLDALVHVASEERRRIAANPPLHDHDRPSRHPDPRPHKRPRSPSSFSLGPGQSASPSTLHPSASPTSGYPTLRPQPVLHIEPTRSPVLSTSDARMAHPPSQRTPPFSLTHSPPRNASPLRHSPQLLRPQHYSPLHMPTAADVDAMSPRYGCGPRMAGGIEVFSSDPSPVRNPPRPFFQSPGRDLSVERFVSESRTGQATHESPKLSPPSARAFSLDDDKRQLMAPFHNAEGPENVFLRERVRPRPHLPFLDATDSPRNMTIPARDPPTQHPSERHPIRVWEEKPTLPEPSRRVSPVRMPDIVSETRMWSTMAYETAYSERPVKEERAMTWRDVSGDVPPPRSTTHEQQQPPRRPTPEFLTRLQLPVKGPHFDSQPLPLIPTLPVHPPPISRLKSPTPPASVSPAFDRPRDVVTQSDTAHHPYVTERSHTSRLATQADADTSVPPAPSDPIVTEPASDEPEQMHVCAAVNANLIGDPHPRQPSSEPIQATPAPEPASTHLNIPKSTRRSPSQPPPALLAKEEQILPSQDMPISPLIQPGPVSRQSPEPERTSKSEPPASELVMMDVDEELLSLVEGPPARAVPTMQKTQGDAKLPQLTSVGQAASAGTEQLRAPSDGPSPIASSQPIFKGPLMPDEEKDRASMPPPPARNKKAEKDKTISATTVTGSKKKKDTTSKPPAKPKQPPKPRAKPAPKPKVKPNPVDASLKPVISKVAVNVSARSRSTSVIPSVVEDVIPEPEVDDREKEDDKLYCVCKTQYDEDRMMIACDRCDEWFHTMCVDMPDLEIDLVDQFICPPCIQKHPHLRTTWKRRCLFGRQHENPSSTEACHKPSRGAFSKYCSDECGVKSMQARIAQWEKSGGVRHLLWEGVKNAPKREGVVVCTATDGRGPGMMDVDRNGLEPKPLDSAAKRRAEREVGRLNGHLEEVVKERELMKRELDMVIWREKVVGFASERAGKLDECGWDQRLCFTEGEWADFGSDVLESYEDERGKVDSGDDATPLEAPSATHEEWWCTGKKKCERHAGWHKLRVAEVAFDKETKEGILLKLTTREREIRKRIEDILYPQPTGTLQASLPGVQLNGSDKPHSPGHISERVKKRTS